MTPQTASAAAKAAELPTRFASHEHLEIALPEGICMRVFGAVPSEQIERVLRLLRR